MDVNGTLFHLVRAREEWAAFEEDADRAVLPLPNVKWDEEEEALAFAPRVYRFVPLELKSPPWARRLDPATRRGAAADRFGTIYWIARDPKTNAATSIWRLRPGRRHGERYWDASALAPPTAQVLGEFAPGTPPAPPVVSLSGLAVTGHHYLIAGNPAGHELLCFDLHAGGEPVHLTWPASVPFEPWDIEPAPRDEFWVLDRVHRTLWRVDRGFGVLPDPVSAVEMLARARPGDFAAVGGVAAGTPAMEFARPIVLSDTVDPISIAALPDDTVLVLDELPDRSASVIARYRGALRVLEFSLADAIPVAEDARDTFSVLGFDLAYVPRARKPLEGGTIVVVGGEGNQAFRFDASWDRTPAIELDCVYVPMERYSGADLVVRARGVLYDFGDRWIELRPVNRPRYAEEATLVGPVFDGHEVGCVWHRLLLDACLPPGTGVTVKVRAAESEEELRGVPWIEQPVPYLRRDGSELPYHRPLGGGAEPFRGTWELLLQDAHGRFLQACLVLHGTGRATPTLHALRVHYPRFSYLERYLPKVYRDDETSASFVERLLADFEGFFTTWEGRIVDVRRYFDPMAAPADALQWLAAWVGVALDPFWTVERRRLFLAHVMDLYRWRGTARGLEMALRLYLDPEPTEEIFAEDGTVAGDAVTVRIVERFRTRQTGGAPQGLEDPRGQGNTIAPLTRERAASAAHRFVVAVPEGLSREQVDVVRRIVHLEKPAHTSFEVQLYWALFRVGAARIAFDTHLGCGPRFRRTLLGDSYLGAGTRLADPHPFDVHERNILDRDRFGDAPPL